MDTSVARNGRIKDGRLIGLKPDAYVTGFFVSSLLGRDVFNPPFAFEVVKPSGHSFEVLRLDEYE